MLCYFISKKDFAILNCVDVNSHQVAHDLNCGGKTKITIAANPNAEDEDFVILKDGKNVKFKGIIENIGNDEGDIKYVISCLEIEQLFNRKILLTDANIIRETGIEDFIVQTIRSFFSESGDAFIDMSYINANALTHTKINAKPSTEDNIYNFKTYLGNVKQQYGIFLDFDFTKSNLNISVHKKEQSEMRIDTTITDVTACKETYKIKVLSKLNVVYVDKETQAESMRYFYLHSDRTVSEVDEDRIDGTISTVRIEAETEAEMIQEAKNEFKSNSYSHSIEAQIIVNSKLYPIEELYVGHEVKIKTASAGVKDSIISEIMISDADNIISVKFGILDVKLTDKLKRREQ